MMACATPATWQGNRSRARAFAAIPMASIRSDGGSSSLANGNVLIPDSLPPGSGKLYFAMVQLDAVCVVDEYGEPILSLGLMKYTSGGHPYTESGPAGATMHWTSALRGDRSVGAAQWRGRLASQVSPEEPDSGVFLLLPGVAAISRDEDPSRLLCVPTPRSSARWLGPGDRRRRSRGAR